MGVGNTHVLRSQPGHSPVHAPPAAPENGEAREKVELRLSGVPGLKRCPGNAQRAADHLRSTVFGASVVAECDTTAATTAVTTPYAADAVAIDDDGRLCSDGVGWAPENGNGTHPGAAGIRHSLAGPGSTTADAVLPENIVAAILATSAGLHRVGGWPYVARCSSTPSSVVLSFVDIRVDLVLRACCCAQERAAAGRCGRNFMPG